MKKLIPILLFMSLGFMVVGQQTIPRYTNATGKSLLYNTSDLTDAAGADTLTITPSASHEVIYRFNHSAGDTLKDSVTVKLVASANTFYGDKIYFTVKTSAVPGAAVHKLRFTSSAKLLDGTTSFTISVANRMYNICFWFDGVQWNEQYQTTFQ
jgi:hypothetical protein